MSIPARRRLDRPVLISNLIAGVVVIVALVAWIPVFLLAVPFALAFVVASSLAFAAVYAREELTWRQEFQAWLAPWLVGCVMWGIVLLAFPSEGLLWSVLITVGVAPILATLCYVPWQVVALVIRQLIAWRAGRSILPTDA